MSRTGRFAQFPPASTKHNETIDRHHTSFLIAFSEVFTPETARCLGACALTKRLKRVQVREFERLLFLHFYDTFTKFNTPFNQICHLEKVGTAHHHEFIHLYELWLTQREQDNGTNVVEHSVWVQSSLLGTMGGAAHPNGTTGRAVQLRLSCCDVLICIHRFITAFLCNSVMPG